MAVEDAVVPAECLRDSPGITSAFTTYERLRRERVERVARTGNDPSQWIYEHHIDLDEPVRSSS